MALLHTTGLGYGTPTLGFAGFAGLYGGTVRDWLKEGQNFGASGGTFVPIGIDISSTADLKYWGGAISFGGRGTPIPEVHGEATYTVPILKNFN